MGLSHKDLAGEIRHLSVPELLGQRTQGMPFSRSSSDSQQQQDGAVVAFGTGMGVPRPPPKLSAATAAGSSLEWGPKHKGEAQNCSNTVKMMN